MFRRQIFSVVLLSMAVLLPFSAYADWQVEVYGGGAGLSTNLSNEIITQPNGSTTNYLQNPSATSTEFEPGFGISYAFPMQNLTSVFGGYYILHDISIGANAYYLSGDRSGQVYNIINSPSTLINDYHTTLSSWQVMLDSEFDFYPIFAQVMPFVEFGLGDAINKMSYGEVNDPNATANSLPINYQSHTSNNFAYQVGAGFKMPVTAHGTVSLRYLYTDMGGASVGQSTTVLLGNAVAQPITANMHSSAVLLGFNYGLDGLF